MELLTIFVALQITDIYTTHNVLKNGGRELNPILNKLFSLFGHLPVLLVFKSAVVFLMAQYVVGSEYGVHILISFCILYSVVVVNNFCHKQWGKGAVQLVKERVA